MARPVQRKKGKENSLGIQLQGRTKLKLFCFFLYPLDAEHIEGIHIGAGKQGSTRRIARNLSAITKNVDIRESHVHSHGAELSTLD